ncbi:MAG: hypothetical protein U0I51_01205 [Muricomes sp.]|nr:hypothetical protein [Muricomes sp.]
MQFGTAGVSQPAGGQYLEGDPGREQRIVAGGTGKCCPSAPIASYKKLPEVERFV